MKPTGTRAVVMGASMAGLLAARVLADAFDEVVLVDRDTLPEGSQPRRGVPQGRQIHILLARGLQALDELLPGLSDDLVARGALSVDLGNDGNFYVGAGLLARRPSEITGILLSRPLLEAGVRGRVLALARVRPVAPATAEPVLDGGRVRGVTLDAGLPGERFLAADLVVDATGRGSRTPVWLERHGLARPEESSIDVGIGYTRWVFPRRPGDLGGIPLVLTFATPELPRVAAGFAVEGDRWLIGGAGYHGNLPPDDLEGFRAFLDSTPAREIAELARSRDPLEPTPATHRFPASVRRHYERLPSLPEGLLVTGDAVASFNPLYGQGMTVAALEALALRDALAGAPEQVSRRFAREVGRVVDMVWDLSAGSDLALPFVPGHRPLRVRLLNRYVDMVNRASTVDPDVGESFGRVINLLDRPETLFRPRTVARVLRGDRRARSTPAPAPTAPAPTAPAPTAGATSAAAPPVPAQRTAHDSARSARPAPAPDPGAVG